MVSFCPGLPLKLYSITSPNLIIPSSLALLDESHAKFRGSVLLGVGVNVELG